MIKKTLALLFLSSCAWAFTPTQYVQISTQTPAPSQQGGIGVSSMTVTSATITNLSVTNTLASVTIGTATMNGQFNYKLLRYRSPNLQWVNGSTVTIETGLDGTSGDGVIVFPDGTVYTESTSTTTRFQAGLGQNANWGNGTQQGGLNPTETLTANRWYNFYAIKSSVTADTTNFVVVGSTWQPTQANYSQLNTFFGTNAWRYLGVIPYGDNSGATTALTAFVQSGNTFITTNTVTNTSSALNGRGVRYADGSGAATQVWQYATGVTVGTQVPAQLTFGEWTGSMASASQHFFITSASGAKIYFKSNDNAGGGTIGTVWSVLSEGVKANSDGTPGMSVDLGGWTDGVLGIGNPLL